MNVKKNKETKMMMKKKTNKKEKEVKNSDDDGDDDDDDDDAQRERVRPDSHWPVSDKFQFALSNQLVRELFHRQHVFHHTAQTHVGHGVNTLPVLEKPQLLEQGLHVFLWSWTHTQTLLSVLEVTIKLVS